MAPAHTGCNCHGCRLRAPAVDIERRAAQKAFDVREFEACHLEAAEETSARQDAPRLRSRALSTCQAFLEKLTTAPPPWQGEAARPVQACLCAPSVWSRRSQGAGQASRRRRGGNGRKRRAGRGRGGGAEDSAEALGTGLSLSATRRLHPRGVLVRSLSFQPRLSSLLGTSLLTQPHSTSLPCPRLLKRMEILKL